MAKEYNHLQDVFLNTLRKERIPVSVFLVNGIKLMGRIESFDQFVVLLKLEDMHLAYSGLRPKLAPPEHHGLMDFVITRDPVHSRAIQLIGIESPGLTAALAIARHVTPMVAETLA